MNAWTFEDWRPTSKTTEMGILYKKMMSNMPLYGMQFFRTSGPLWSGQYAIEQVWIWKKSLMLCRWNRILWMSPFGSCVHFKKRFFCRTLMVFLFLSPRFVAQFGGECDREWLSDAVPVPLRHRYNALRQSSLSTCSFGTTVETGVSPSVRQDDDALLVCSVLLAVVILMP